MIRLLLASLGGEAQAHLALLAGERCTRNGRPLDPRYVSSVDSGNLAGHLVTLAHACREPSEYPRIGAALAGIDDTASLVRESVRTLADRRRAHAVTRRRLDQALDVMAASIEESARTPGAWAVRLAELEARFVGRVEIIYQQNHWALCSQPQKERYRSIEERPLFSLWIAHPQPLEMGNGVLLRGTLVLG